MVVPHLRWDLWRGRGSPLRGHPARHPLRGLAGRLDLPGLWHAEGRLHALRIL